MPVRRAMEVVMSLKLHAITMSLLALIIVSGCGGGCPTERPAGGGGAWVNLMSDRSNCGACGNAGAGGVQCVGGKCVLPCGAGRTACGDACVDTAMDPLHCGACFTRCAAGEACASGKCVAGGSSCSHLCNGVCTTLESDRANCGACTNAC